ncbi:MULTISPECIES: hypothetical protein [Betaproteobacteria]|jgi:hypothetical protein|uniref:hypothetical protein n=1 Tax=Betaproteobacteria TaxID=28216 RepID=UPI0009A475D0|nr:MULTISPECIES: hypothetical protein [Betaproteobacteria]
MKAKPDIGFAQRKDLNEFLESGAADRAEKPAAPAAPAPAATPPVVEEGPRYGRARVQKIFNFPEELADRLREEASARSKQTGRRVTEKDIVVEALEAFLKR